MPVDPVLTPTYFPSTNLAQVEPSQYAAKYVELTFRDQYVGRSDMWRLRTSLVGTCVYEAKKIVFLGCIRVQVKEIYIGNQSVGHTTALASQDQLGVSA
jgi:hypothetical protein